MIIAVKQKDILGRVSAVLDKINHSVMCNEYMGSQSREKDWFMKRELLSPRYTTRWEDIPVVE